MYDEITAYLKKAYFSLSNGDVENKLEAFIELYNWLSEQFPIESKKIKLYSVNRFNGKVDEEYLLKYREKRYIEKNIEKIIAFLETKQKALKISRSDNVLYIKRLKLENFRSISDMTIHFEKGINVLIGDNGMGKSSILDAVSIGLSDIIRSFNVTRKIFNAKDMSINSEISSIQMILQDFNCEYYFFQGRNKNNAMQLFPLNSIKPVDCKELNEYLQGSVLYPIISYHCISNEEKKTRYKSKQKDVIQGYVGCLNGKADIKWVESWLSDSNKSDIEKYLSIVNKFVEGMLDVKKLSLKYKDDIFVVKSNKGDIPLDCMSSGFQTMLNLIIDISYRLTVLNPSIVDPTNMFGIVLIDEIELHLHPKWQWKILSVLEDMFPKIQFIVTTHSPMVISSCKKCNLILIGKNEMGEIECIPQSSDGLYGKSIEDVIYYNMGSQNIPIDLYRDYEQFQLLYNAGRYEEARILLKKIQEKYGKDNSTVKSIDFLLNLSFDE